MIDQEQRINVVVRGELAKAALALGIDKSMAGHHVTKSFAPIQAPNGETGLFLCWVVSVTLRVPLVGYPDIEVPVILPAPPGTLPSDDGFRGSARTALEEASKIYRSIIDGDASGKGLGKYAA